MRTSYTFITNPEPLPIDEVTLVMSFEEAKALRVVTGSISGGGTLGVAMLAIWEELRNLPGMPTSRSVVEPFQNEGDGGRVKEDYEL